MANTKTDEWQDPSEWGRNASVETLEAWCSKCKRKHDWSPNWCDGCYMAKRLAQRATKKASNV